MAVPLAAMATLILAGCSSTAGVRAPSPSARSASPSAGGTATACAPAWHLSAALVPSGGAAANTWLAGVAAISPTDVWAVGGAGPAGQAATTLTEHWNGNTWSIVKSPDASNEAALGGDQLTAVAAVSAADIWAVGYIGTPGVSSSAQEESQSTAVQTLTEHWNGTAWSVVDAPDAPARDGVEPWDVLTSIAATSTDDVWAVGVTEWPLTYGGGNFVAAQPLVEHWNGSYWAIVAVPDPEPAPPDWALAQGGNPPAATATVGSVALLGVTASSAGDVWLVGGYEADMGVQTYVPGPWETLTEHWNGTAWSAIPAPDATLPEPLSGGSTAADDLLTSASESSDGTLWAVGGALPGAALTLQLGLAFGTSSFTGWHLVPSLAVTTVNRTATLSGGSGAESFAPGTSALAGVVTISATDAWAVGAVILHWDGVAWEPMYTVDGAPFDYLTGVAAGPGGLWAVGGTSIVHATCS
ncbi:MAG: hypothetical protein ABR950_02065 [Candidatus Dormibacteria bacterium]|jgi:hypothetical protein